MTDLFPESVSVLVPKWAGWINLNKILSAPFGALSFVFFFLSPYNEKKTGKAMKKRMLFGWMWVFAFAACMEKDPLSEKALAEVFEAARTDNIPVLMEAVRGYTNYVWYRETNSGDTLLHVSARNGAQLSSIFLYACGLDFDSKNFSGETPFLLAGYSGNLQLVEYMVDEGADFGVTNRNGSALHFAASGGKTNVMSYLYSIGLSNGLPNESGQTPQDLLTLFLETNVVLKDSIPTN